MLFRYFRTGLLAAIAAALIGCSDPPAPPEVQQALNQEQDLWRAGAVVYAPDEYNAYLTALQSGRDYFVREQGRFVWFRDYDAVGAAFRQLLDQGEQVADAARANRERQAGLAADRLARLEERVRALRRLIGSVKDRRLSKRSLVAAEIAVEEARLLVAAGKSAEAQAKATEAEAAIGRLSQAIRPLLSRYADRQQIARWSTLAAEAIAASRRSGGYAIVVHKLDRKLVLYRGGAQVRSYPAGMGFNYLADKLHAGDLATPEGHYRVARKNAASRYFRALLIDYPTEADRRRFAQAKRSGQVPAGTGIGSLIEIHGGGKDGMTNGCVALENPQMQELFDRAEVGTPVVIIGTLNPDNIVAKTLPWLD
ncbi:MAG: L,D-transpeptidase family protein [Desulfuromonadales bacterium]|nr:L,D-transpeptidase family protein [Desulfuromonadales bacterium]